MDASMALDQSLEENPKPESSLAALDDVVEGNLPALALVDVDDPNPPALPVLLHAVDDPNPPPLLDLHEPPFNQENSPNNPRFFTLPLNKPNQTPPSQIDHQSSPQLNCFVIPIRTATTLSPPSPAPSQPDPSLVPQKSSQSQEIQAEPVLVDLLFTLRQLRMTQPDRHREAVERLRELEQELREAGAVCPPDPAVAEAVARALASATPGHDIQIRVNQSRHTTTTKTVYETETPGMLGLSADHIRTLHRQMLDSLASGTTSDSHVESGTTQKRETAEEGFTDEDGALVVSKRMTRLVTTTRSALPGEGEATSGE